MNVNAPNPHWTTASGLGVHDYAVTTESHVSKTGFEAERERIFRSLWIMGGRAEEIPNSGDYFLRPIPTLDVEALIVRGKEGEIRAFYNTCSHRGVTVVNQPRGCAQTFRCPYHSWLYGADGTLRSIPAGTNFPFIDKSEHGLKPIQVDSWNGFIFLNFSPAPAQSLTEFLGGIGELHATLPFGRYPFFIQTSSEVASNWKSCMYTFMEGYHITTAHRKTLTPQIVTKQNPFFNFFDIRLFGPHSTLTSERNFDWVPSTPVVKFSIGQMPSVTLPRDAADAEQNFATHPSINRIGIPNFGVETITIFPNVCLQPLGGGYLWMEFWPLSADRTRVEVRMHSERPPSSLREEFAAANSAAAARDVLTEDFSICELQQRGFSMAANEFQYFGENEALLRHFANTVAKYINGNAVPSISASRNLGRNELNAD